MFLLSRAIPELESELGYEPSLKGPMSEALEWDVDQLVSVDLLSHEGSSYVITKEGDVCAKAASREVLPTKLKAIDEVKELHGMPPSRTHLQRRAPRLHLLPLSGHDH